MNSNRCCNCRDCQPTCYANCSNCPLSICPLSNNNISYQQQNSNLHYNQCQYQQPLKHAFPSIKTSDNINYGDNKSIPYPNHINNYNNTFIENVKINVATPTYNNNNYESVRYCAPNININQTTFSVRNWNENNGYIPNAKILPTFNNNINGVNININNINLENNARNTTQYSSTSERSISVPDTPQISVIASDYKSKKEQVLKEHNIKKELVLKEQVLKEQFICLFPGCKRTFKHKSNAKTHFKIHTDDAVVCNWCNKKFARKSNLKQHVRKHTGEKPFKCNMCNKRFKQSHSLKEHLVAHNGIKRFECRICSKRFTSKNYLTSHMRTHK